MDGLLFLAHRIPFPPNKGDKIRSFHFLKHLAGEYRIYLGAFVDDPADWEHSDEIGRYCAETCLVPLDPARARIRGLRGFATNAPLSLAYFSDRRLREWVRRVLEEEMARRVLAFSTPMAQYVMEGPAQGGVWKVLDLVDVDSDKWRQYAKKKPWPVSAIYAREARALLRYERRAAAAFDAAVFVSRAEADLFSNLAPEVQAKVTHIENGVDTDYFSPDRQYPDPYVDEGPVLVFTGSMDYWANVDAVTWFVEKVLPGVRQRVPETRFFIVGSNPTEQVLQLGRQPGVTVTGRVEDVRPYLAHARASVAPLRVARGLQNKVLEAMAMDIPVVASPQALDGLEFGEPYPLAAAEPGDWTDLAASLLQGRLEEGAEHRLRHWAVSRYAWEGKVERLSRLFSDHPAATDCHR